jgi:hypothetical protein
MKRISDDNQNSHTQSHNFTMGKQAQTSATTTTAGLNIYKKVSVIRHPDDQLNYEDAEGTIKTVSVQELGDAIRHAVRYASWNLDLYLSLWFMLSKDN